MQFEGASRSRCRPSRPFSSGRNRTVLQDALSEVMKVYPPLKLRVLVDDVTAFMDERYKDLPGIAEKVLKLLKKADALGQMRDAKADGEAYDDRGSVKHIVNRNIVRRCM